MNYWAIFITGLTTGGLSCLAMQGGLLASTIATYKKLDQEDTTQIGDAHSVTLFEWLPIGLFLITKLIAHTLLGFLLGWIGSQVQLSLTLRLVFQGIAALFLLATAGNLLELHPIFRYVVFQPPKWIHRMVRNSSKKSALFTPAVLGFLTILIPCGVTQSMEVLAISTGNPITGALLMFFFVLGTSPLFALVGVLTSNFTQKFQQHFLKIAALLLVVLSVSSLNGILIVINSPVTIGTVTQPFVHFFSPERFKATPVSESGLVNGVQHVLINIHSTGYSPDKIQVKVGIPVQLTLQTKDTYSCASSFVLKEFNIMMQLAPNDSQTVLFTPTHKGKFPFSCSMGMYTGLLEVL